MSEGVDPLIADDGTVLGYNCIECGTTKTTEAGATEHCRNDEDGTNEAESVAVADAPAVELDVYPTNVCRRAGWVPWSDWDRKQPNAEAYSDAENPYSWSDPANWTTFEHAGRVARRDDDLAGIGFILQNPTDPYDDDPDSLTVADYDDARDPETGQVHPLVREHIQHAESYADVSYSATGVHIVAVGELPEGVRTIEDDLPAHPEFPDASIEVYDGKRFMAFTGRHIKETPGEARDAQAFVDELADEFVTVAEGTPDGLAQEPEKTRAELADVETTTEMQDVLDAIQHTGPGDVYLRSTVTEERADGSKSINPSWNPSERGDKLAEFADGWVFRDGMHGLDALQVVALEERIVTSEGEYPSGEDFFETIAALRERGAHIPEYDDPDDEAGNWQQVVALPSESPKGRVWNWRKSGERLASEDGDGDPWIAHQEAQQRTQRTIERAFDNQRRTIVAALPGLGKSHGSILAAAETGTPISFLTGRGREEQYQQVKQWCENAGLRAKVLPAVTEDCPTFTGEHGEEIKTTVRNWYENGATGKDVHKYGDRRLDQPLPCQDGGHCPYTAKWDFDPEEYDVLIGHPNHIHVPKVANGRTAVFDESTDDFEAALVGDRLSRAVTRHLKRDRALPFENYTDLIENRNDDERRTDALDRLIDQGIDRDHEHAFEDDGHALAPLATFVLLASAIEDNQHENGFSTVGLPGDADVGTFYPEWGRENDPAVHLLLPPTLDYTRGVVGLDGTPTRAMWERALGTGLNLMQVLDDDERRTYLTDTAAIEFVVTNDHARPLSGNPEDFPVASAKALARAVAIRHDDLPDLVTSGKMYGRLAGSGGIAAENDEEGNEELYGDGLYYGNLKGSNQLKHSRAGIVEGSTHYGDEYIQKWGAFAGENVERGEGKGLDLSYGPFGDKILRHMREHQTLQGALRFGRDGNGATVYVNTNTLPEWVPAKRVGGVLTTKGKGERQVVAALTDLGGEATRSQVQKHEGVSVSRQSIERVLNRLSDDGRIKKEWASGQNVYSIAAFGDLNEHGEVDLRIGEDAKSSHDAHTAYSNVHREGEHRGAPSHDPALGRSDPPTEEHASEREGIGTDGGDDPPDPADLPPGLGCYPARSAIGSPPPERAVDPETGAGSRTGTIPKPIAPPGPPPEDP